jgi:hypothetical protein
VQCPGEWIYTDCHFAIKLQKAKSREKNPMEFYKTLICCCGKEIGEIQFSGYEPGKWRIF